jgi:hypothetical protein
LQSGETSAVNVAPPGTPPAEAANVDFTGESVTVETAQYNEDVQLDIIGYNSKDEAGATSGNLTSARVDTVSDESSRLVAGSGEFPAAGYGGAFVSGNSLKTTYTEELQMLNGEYRRPTGDYSGNAPTAGEDYSAGMGTAYRYCIASGPFALSNASSFELDIDGAVGFGANPEEPDVRIQVKVDGVTGWLDANAAYPLVGSPSADGDPAMVFAESTATSKKVTFGSTPRTGNLQIRIGLPDGSAKRFTGITVSNIQ